MPPTSFHQHVNSGLTEPFYYRKVLLTARPQGYWECSEAFRGQLVGEGNFACAFDAVG